MQEELRLKATQILEELVLAKKLSRKEINNLPDEAFSFVERGGRKDEENKTIPRALRHAPHHKSNVRTGKEHDTVDKSHLRNALARFNQIKSAGPKDSTAKIRKAVKNHLIRHARKLLPNTKFASMDESDS